ncbi:MAG TPA: S1C family serine protease [Terriglobales bacterium]|nr:S1C family serine protease [Terriglobales bacterium]
MDALSVVKLRSKTVSGARSAETLGTRREGTGVVIDGKGLVLTIGYLILEAESIELSTVAGHSVPASVVAYDAETGFGLVRALGPLPITPVTFGESAGVAARDRVLIVGFDGVAPAYVVSRRPFVAYWEYLLPDAIYTAPATVNWQGAALLDRQQRLIGIGYLAVPDALAAEQQIPGNLFVPIDRLKPILADLVARGRAPTPPRPWLGIYTREVEGNVIVTRVAAEGPADRGPVRPGDVVVAIDGQPVKGQAEFYQRIWKSGDPGRELALDVLREGRIQRVTVKTSHRDQYYRARPTY